MHFIIVIVYGFFCSSCICWRFCCCCCPFFSGSNTLFLLLIEFGTWHTLMKNTCHLVSIRYLTTIWWSTAYNFTHALLAKQQRDNQINSSLEQCVFFIQYTRACVRTRAHAHICTKLPFTSNTYDIIYTLMYVQCLRAPMHTHRQPVPFQYLLSENKVLLYLLLRHCDAQIFRDGTWKNASNPAAASLWLCYILCLVLATSSVPVAIIAVFEIPSIKRLIWYIWQTIDSIAYLFLFDVIIFPLVPLKEIVKWP